MMGRIRTPLEAELLKGLRVIVERLEDLRMSQPDDKATSDLPRGIRDKITEIESSNNNVSRRN
jgi:hypothetical protein